MNGTQISAVRSRLSLPPGLSDLDERKWRVLCETIFPSAKSAEAIVMAIDYCHARGLDVFKRPVHIVPMWNSRLQSEVETVWPGINEIQTTAARTRQWAGMDEPKWGPDVTQTFKGRRRIKGNWEAHEANVTFPEWCAVTVYRMIEGQRCGFTEPVYWMEAYSRSGGQNSELPTDIWIKRPRGQIHKVAKAASLRAAFPEDSGYTAEEMEGKEIEAGGIVIEHKLVSAASLPPTTAPAKSNDAPPHSDHPRRAEALQAYKKLSAALDRIGTTPQTIEFLDKYGHAVFPDLDLIGEVNPDTHANLKKRFAGLGIDIDAERARLRQREPGDEAFATEAEAARAALQ